MTTATSSGRAAAELCDPSVRTGHDFVPDEEFFGRSRPAFGIASLGLSVGPLLLRLEGLSADQKATLALRFRPFIAGGDNGRAPDLVVRLTRAGVPAFLSLPVSGSEHYRMGRRSRAGARDYWAYEFAGTLAAGRGVAELALVASSGALFERGLENFLRPLTASYVLAQGGLLLHAAGVVRDGRAYVFFGPSGSGKTTVTHLSPRDLVLSDDLTLVVHEAGEYRAAGIPFGMAHHHVPDSGGSFPIAALARLVQSPQVRRERLTGGRALAEIASCLPFVNHEGGEAARALEVAGRLLDAVPAWRLSFRKDDSFWEVLQES
jgi:hypothetical protein